jgi:hypothetical protein
MMPMTKLKSPKTKMIHTMEYFAVHELVDRETYERMGDLALSLFRPCALEALDDLRKYFQCAITVNNWHSGGDFQWRGYRTLTEATRLGAPNSRHAFGEAFDCDIHGVPAEEARKRILENQDNPLLSKITRMEAGVTWLHFDVMELPPGFKRIHLFKR